jgi:Domain of unknown function (DUF6538)
MKKVSETHHLHKRSGVWYYRRRVPTPLVPIFKKNFIQLSLGTPFLKQAVKKRELLDVEWTKKFEETEAALRGPLTQTEQPPPTQLRVLTEAEAIERVRAYVEKTDERRRKDALTADPVEPHERNEWLKELELELAIARDRAPQYDHHAHIHSHWKEVFRDGDAAIDETMFPAPAIFDLVKHAAIELERRALARAHDDHRHAFFDRLFDSMQLPAVTVPEIGGAAS